MMYKILKGSDTASRTVLQKKCSRICGLNPGLITTITFSLKNAANRTLFP